MKKRPFDVDLAVNCIRKAVSPFPKAAMFELAEEGFDSPFELLVACIISIRTRDEVTMPCAQRLFELARTPAQVSKLTPEQIDAAISISTGWKLTACWSLSANIFAPEISRDARPARCSKCVGRWVWKNIAEDGCSLRSNG